MRIPVTHMLHGNDFQPQPQGYLHLSEGLWKLGTGRGYAVRRPLEINRFLLLVMATSHESAIINRQNIEVT